MALIQSAKQFSMEYFENQFLNHLCFCDLIRVVPDVYADGTTLSKAKRFFAEA